MIIIIYHLEDINGEIRAIELDRWDNGEFQGVLKKLPKMTENQVINRWNTGHWRTSAITKKVFEKFEIDLDLLQKVKTRKRVWVKPTATKKGYYREQEVGRKEIEKKPPRKDTGKIASLPEDIKKEILDLRRLGDSGARIKEVIENMIDVDPDLRDKLEEKGIVKISAGAASLTVTGQSLVDWAKARGVESRVKRRTVETVSLAAKVASEKQFEIANKQLAKLKTENKQLKDQLEIERKSKMTSDEIRDKLRSENFILREKLKVIK